MIDATDLDKLAQAYDIVHAQTLHQWRMTWDGDYRLHHSEFLEECGITMEMLNEEGCIMIPIPEEW